MHPAYGSARGIPQLSFSQAANSTKKGGPREYAIGDWITREGPNAARKTSVEALGTLVSTPLGVGFRLMLR